MRGKSGSGRPGSGGKGGGSGKTGGGKTGGSRVGARPRGQRELKQRLTSARGRTVASQRWLMRQLNDPYVAAAKREGYRSRAAYKLMEIDDKYRLLKPGHRVVDLGAAPGGWSQVAADRVHSGERAGAGHRGRVVAIDILPMEALPGITVLHLDFLAEEAPERLRAELEGGRADVVLSDMAAETTGHTRTDHMRIMGLAEVAAQFATDVLEPGGSFVCKVFQGGTERALLDLLKRAFASVRHVKPPASRSDSAELYVVAMGFRGERTPSGSTEPPERA